jgi:glycine cleavage system H protein
VAHLPLDYLYSSSHYWIARHEGQVWRVGLTRFATRMLGEIVDCEFEVASGAAVEPGVVLGWIEGFKAISDIFCIARGSFKGPNPALKERIALVNSDPCSAGWLFAVDGEPDHKCVDVRGYCDLLDKTIDRLVERESSSKQH